MIYHAPPDSRFAAVARFVGHGGYAALYLLAGLFVLTAASTALGISTLVKLRFQRDVTRAIYEDDREVLESTQAHLRLTEGALRQELALPDPSSERCIVLSLTDHHLWFRHAGEVLFNAPIATGSGKTLVREVGQNVWRFDTPRGRLVVRAKELDPLWVPPDWHYVEQARLRGLGLLHVPENPEEPTRLGDGSVIELEGEDLVRSYPDGRRTPLSASAGSEIVVDGRIIVPPVGSAPRRYKDVLGTHLLSLGDGYAIHGTNQPETIGRSVSHGCVRLRNQDMAKLYDLVEVGTPVYIY